MEDKKKGEILLTKQGTIMDRAKKSFCFNYFDSRHEQDFAHPGLSASLSTGSVYEDSLLSSFSCEEKAGRETVLDCIRSNVLFKCFTASAIKLQVQVSHLGAVLRKTLITDTP